MIFLLEFPKKKKAIWLQGPANSGKTLLIMSLVDLVGSYGFTRELTTSGFPYMDLINKKILILDEPVIPENKKEDFKLILAGQSIKVNCKFSTYQNLMISGTFIMSNQDNEPFDLNQDYWLSRITKYQVKALPEFFKENLTGAPHPMGWLKVLKQYTSFFGE